MKRRPFLTATVLASTLFLFSCGNSDKTGLDIPKDAAMVLHINSSSLSSKLSWNEIKATSWFKEASEKQHDSLTSKILENPENSGIDIKSDIVVFAKKQGSGGYMVVEGKLKDAAAFEAFVKQTHKSDNEVMKDGNLKYIKAGRNEIVSWTDSKFIAMSDAPIFNQMNIMARRRWDDERKSFSIDSLKQFTKDLLALKSSERLGTDERFSNLLKETGDVHFWMNMDQYISSMGSVISMFKFGSLLEGNAATYTLNFDDGKISMKSKTYFGKEMAKLMEKFKSREIDASLINRIPSNNVVAVMAMNGDPGFIRELIKAGGFDGMVNGFLGERNLTLDELTDASKGQFLLSVSDLDMKNDMHIEKNFNVLFATSVKNKSTFDKLLNMFKEEMHHEEEDSTVNYKLTNDWFAVSNNMNTVDKFLAGGTTKQPFTDKITGNSFGLYVDLQKLIKGMHTNLRDASDSATFDASIKMWQDVIGKSGGYKDGVATGQFEVNLVDKSKNSLKQLNEYIDKLTAAHKLKRQEVWMNPPTIDTAIPPVIEAMPDAPKENR